MKEWTIFIIAAMIFMTFLFALFTALFRPQHVRSEIVKNQKQLRDIIDTYGSTEKFKIHHVQDLKNPYAEITYNVDYKRNFRNLHELEETSREISRIDYYIKL